MIANDSRPKWLKQITDYLKAITWVIIPFSLLGSIHYIFTFFSRDILLDENKRVYQNMGVDYWGIIVGFFAVLVTLLVAWNIYSTIKAKDELTEYKDKFDEISKLRDKLNNLEGRLTRDSQYNMPKSDNAPQKATAPVQINLPQNILDFARNDMAKRNSPLWKWLYKMVCEERSDAYILEEYYKFKDKKPQKVAYIDGKILFGSEVIGLLEEIRSIHVMIINATK